MSVELRNYVFDDAGNAVGASVSATGRAHANTYTTTANTSTGEWSLSGMVDDIYDVTITYLGKVRKQKGDVKIQVEGFVDTVGSTPVADNSVTSGKLADGAVTTIKIADNAVTSAKLAAGAVGSSDLANGAVTEDKLATGAVTSTKLASGAVGTAQIADGSITDAKLASGVGGSGGSATIADGSVTNAKLADGAVSTSKLSTYAVQTGNIGTGAVIGTKIANGTMLNQNFANNTISGARLIDGTITAAKLASGVGGGSLTSAAGHPTSNQTVGYAQSYVQVASTTPSGAGTYLILGAVDLTWVGTGVGSARLSLFVNSAQAGQGQATWTNADPTSGDRLTLSKAWLVTTSDSTPTFQLFVDCPSSGVAVTVAGTHTEIIAVKIA